MPVDGEGRRGLPCDLGLYGVDGSGAPSGCDTFARVSALKDSQTLNVVDEASPEFLLIRNLARMGFGSLRLDLGAELNTTYVQELIRHFRAHSTFRSEWKNPMIPWIAEFYGGYRNLGGVAGGPSGLHPNVRYYDDRLRKNMIKVWRLIQKGGWSGASVFELFEGSIVKENPRLAYNWIDNHNIGGRVTPSTPSNNFPGNSPGESIDPLLWAYTILFTLPSTISVWIYHDPRIRRIPPISDEFLPEGVRSITDARMTVTLTELSRLRASRHFDTSHANLRRGSDHDGLTSYRLCPTDGEGDIVVYVGRVTEHFITEVISRSEYAPLDIYGLYDSWASERWAPVVVAVKKPYTGRYAAGMRVSERLEKGLPLLEAYCQFRYSDAIRNHGLVQALTINTDNIEAAYSGVWLPSCLEQAISRSAGFAPREGFGIRPYWAYGTGVPFLERYIRDLNKQGQVFAMVDTTIRKYHTGWCAMRAGKRRRHGCSIC